MTVEVAGGALPPEEIERYKAYMQEKYPNRRIERLTLTVDGEYVEIGGVFAHAPFDRIRRITGYLVGTMDHWNNAKRAEEKDRVKHVSRKPRSMRGLLHDCLVPSFRKTNPNKPFFTMTCSDKSIIGVPEGIRTPDLLIRSQTLYPAELLAHDAK